MGKRKTFYQLFISLALIIAAICGRSMETEAASAKEAKAAFRDLLEQDPVVWADWNTESVPQDSCTFCYTTIGEVKVPILIAYSGMSSHASGYVHVYQYINGKAKLMMSGDWLDGLYRKAGVIAFGHSGGGYGTRDVWYCKLTAKNRLKECASSSILYEKDWGDSYEELRKLNGPDTYEVKGKSVSKKKFQSYIEKILNGDKNKAGKAKLVKNTAENRQKYL